MTLDEFSVLCQSRRELAPLWQNLVDEAHQLIAKRVRLHFLGYKRGPSEEEFLMAKGELERACLSAGIETPALDFKEFKNWILRY